MGIKKRKTIISLITCSMLLCYPLVPSAATVEDLYDAYGMEYEVDIPQDITETIKNYNAAQRYLKQYHYVATATYDTDPIKADLKKVETEMDKVETELRKGYNLTITEIYALEERYVELSNDKKRLESALVMYEPDWSAEVAVNVPDYSSYEEAVHERDAILSSSEIGNVEDVTVPVQAKALLYDNDDLRTIYKTVSGASILAMFNGTVTSIENDKDYGLTVTIDHNNNVYSYCCNLKDACVKVGDTVYQGQVVGYTLDSLAVFRLKLDGTFVDVSKLYKQEE